VRFLGVKTRNISNQDKNMEKLTNWEKQKKRIEDKLILRIVVSIVSRYLDDEEIILPIEIIEYMREKNFKKEDTIGVANIDPKTASTLIYGKKVKGY
jgi:hypothetical protein